MAINQGGEHWLNVRTSKGKFAGRDVQRLLGFWVIWHSYGGFNELVDARVISRTGVYQHRKEFIETFGIDVDNFMPDIAASLWPISEAATPEPSSRWTKVAP